MLRPLVAACGFSSNPKLWNLLAEAASPQCSWFCFFLLSKMLVPS